MQVGQIEAERGINAQVRVDMREGDGLKERMGRCASLAAERSALNIISETDAKGTREVKLYSDDEVA